MARKEILGDETLRARNEARVESPDEQADLAESAPVRPTRLAEFIGQDAVRENLELAIGGARARGEPVDHILFHGPPGLGKTTLAMLIAAEMGTSIRITSGAVLERPGDLVSTITTLEDGDVLFIDEIHRLRPQIEEFLYPAMEDQRIDIRVDDGPGAQTVTLPTARFTLVGATTRAGLLTAPLRARFGLELRLESYNAEALSQIVLRAAPILGVACDPDGAEVIAQRSRGTPRLALRLLARARDWAQVHGTGVITRSAAVEALKRLGIDDLGLNPMDRAILKTIVERHRGGPVGLNTLAASLGEDPATLEESHEPFLLQAGLIERTPRGRTASIRAFELLGVTPPEDQPRLL